jgi:hypothetical protein
MEVSEVMGVPPQIIQVMNDHLVLKQPMVTTGDAT